MHKATDEMAFARAGEEHDRAWGRESASEEILAEIINPSLDGPLNLQPDHIAEINARVDAVFGKPDDATDAGEKVALPGKWSITYPEKRAVRFGGIINQNASAVSYARDESEADDFVAAANKLRELTFAAAFRAGVEAAAKLVDTKPADASRAVTVAHIRAIPTPSLD
jgi:hypothetical protein